MRLSVLKFGGSSFAGQTDFCRVAGYIKQRLSRGGGKVVVVVSAPAGMTEWLRDWALRLNRAPSDAATASLLPLADIVGMGLLRVAIEAQGLAVGSLSGYQLGIRTDSNFSWAKIQHFDIQSLYQILSAADVAVIPGGQGIDAEGHLTWLGKNSSDLSAVAVAAALSVAECEIFSDVAGIYSADPNLINNTRLFDEIPYTSAISMSISGAKMMHYGAIEHAMQHNVSIVCRLNSGGYDIGTRIGTGAHHPAVVVDLRSEVFDFPSAAEQDKAHRLLETVNVPFVRVRSDSEFVSAITCGFFNGCIFFEQRRIRCKLRSARLVSYFASDGDTRRYLVADSDIVHFSQQLHDRIYRGFAHHAAEG